MHAQSRPIVSEQARTASRLAPSAAGLLAAALGMVAAAAPSGEATELPRLIHQSQQASLEAAWMRLFPEGPTLAQSVLVLSDETDDAHVWATRLSVHDRDSGAEIAFGGFMPSGESAAILLEVESEDEFPQLEPVIAHGQVVSGMVFGLDGASRPVVGLRLRLDIASLAAIVPVEIEFFAPFAFPADELAADVMVLEAKAALASMTQEGDALGFGGPDPTGDPTAACRAAMGECVEGSWRSMMIAIADAWAQTGIAGSAAFTACMASTTDECDPACRALGCLLEAGIDFAVAGDGSIGWTWAHRLADVAACEDQAAACIAALPEGGGDVRPGRDRGR